MRPLILLAALLCGSAQAADLCKPSQFAGTGSKFVKSFNDRGAWAGWWCPDGQGGWYPYVAVITPKFVKNFAVQKLVADWVENGIVDDLAFGDDPFTNPTLRAVWEPEGALLTALLPAHK